MFASTTVLGFTPLFANPERADLLAAAILQTHRFHKAHLFAFVIMPEHIHLLTRCPAAQSPRQFMDILKSATANWLLDALPSDLRQKLDEADETQKGGIWMKGFRSVEVFTEEVFVQKMDYIHNNPVKRGLCSEPAQYRWSSAEAYYSETGLPSDEVSIADWDTFVRRWPQSLLPPLQARRR